MRPEEGRIPKTGKKPKNKPKPPVNETTAVLAFDLTGKPLWKTDIGASGDGGGYVGPRCTPTVDGDSRMLSPTMAI